MRGQQIFRSLWPHWLLFSGAPALSRKHLRVKEKMSDCEALFEKNKLKHSKKLTELQYVWKRFTFFSTPGLAVFWHIFLTHFVKSTGTHVERPAHPSHYCHHFIHFIHGVVIQFVHARVRLWCPAGRDGNTQSLRPKWFFPRGEENVKIRSGRWRCEGEGSEDTQLSGKHI